SSVDIVATEDGTDITVHPSAAVIGGPGVGMLMPGQSATFRLNESDVLQLEALMPSGDLSGTYIEASSAIAVFAGAECAVNGDPRPGGTGGQYCDHIEEQLLPLQAWGKAYVAARVVPQSRSDGCDFGGPPETSCPPSRWRILASVDGSQVS